MNEHPLSKQFTAASILTFAFPNIIMMVFLSLYTIADGMFISRLTGELALSATNMFYPVTSIQLAIAVMLGTGGSAIIARYLGQGRIDRASEVFSLITAAAFLVGLLSAALCLLFSEKLLLLLGVTPLQMSFARTYGRCMLLFSPLMFLQLIFQIFFVTDGRPGLGLGLTAAGGITNMVLDWLFMGPFQMGVLGAAAATGIGYSITAVPGLLYFCSGKHGTLHFTCFPFRPRILLRACANGSSEMVTNLAYAVTTFLFNLLFLKYRGENGVAAITILSYFQFVFSAVFMGFSMGLSPMISYKYGAGDEPQLKKLLNVGLCFVALTSAGVYVLSLCTIHSALTVFTGPESPVYEIAINGFTIYALQFLFMGFSIFASGVFTALGNGIVSAVISLSRTFLFLVGCLLLLPAWFGETGIWVSVPAAEVLGFSVSLFCLIRGRKHYPI